MNHYENIILSNIIKLKFLKTSNNSPTLGVEPDNILLVGRENSD